MNAPDYRTQISSPEDLKPPFGEGPLVRVLRLLRICPLLVWTTSIISPVFARPVQGQQQIQKRDNNANGGEDTINPAIWVPILVVTLVFAALSLVACVRRSMSRDIASLNAGSVNPTSTLATTGTMTRRRRRPRRTPSQISTKSLPPYMKEPGDHELVIYRGPQDLEDGHEPQGRIAMPTVAEGDEPSDLQTTAFNLSLHRVESHDTSTTNLIRNTPMRVSGDQIPGIRQSLDAPSITSSAQSHGSNAGLLPGHERMPSGDPGLGEAPPYSEAISGDVTMTTIPLNDPDPHPAIPPSSPVSVGPANVSMPEHSTEQGDNRRSRFSFLLNPFSTDSSSTNHSPYPLTSITNHATSPSLHSRTGSALSMESTDSSPNHRPTHHSSRSGSGSGFSILRGLRSRSPHNPRSGVPMSSPSTISVDSISAPLTHTLTRSEFRAPKGGLTADQIKLITSRDALESRRFGVPYGADAVAAFSASRLNVDAGVPPPDFESAMGSSTAVVQTETQPQTEPTETPTLADGDISVSVDLETAVTIPPERLEPGRSSPTPSSSLLSQAESRWDGRPDDASDCKADDTANCETN
ncbi:hypothetical protein F5I97DRAFT_159750 [Phlebopus sp. FC_14]|nr:hypothetical protein F5I97DRAFT_159750 [Phlebopus sp. FC_14]